MNRLAVVAQIIVILLLTGIGMAAPDCFDAWTREDSVIEWLTALLFMGGGVRAAVAARRAATRSAPIWTVGGFALLAAGLGVVGFEEISWGQRIFALQTPEGLRQLNTQDEVNLHNIATGLTQKIAILGSFVCGVGLPLLCIVSPRLRRVYEARLQLRAPTPLVAVPCLLGYALCNPDWLLPELTLGLTHACCGALAAMLLTSSHHHRSRPDAMLILAGIVVALGIRVAFDILGAWANGWMELGEESLALAAMLLAMSPLLGNDR